MLKKTDPRQVQRSMREAERARAAAVRKEGVTVLPIMPPDRDPGPAPGRPRVDALPLGMFGERALAQVRANHGQSAVALARRGGLSAPEAVCALRGRHWRDGMPSEDEAHAILHAMLADYAAGAGKSGRDRP